MEDGATEHRTALIQAILQRRNDPKVTAAPTQTPKQVCVFIGVRGQEAVIGRNYVRAYNVVDGQAVPGMHVAPAAAERKAGNAGPGNDPQGGGQTERLGLA